MMRPIKFRAWDKIENHMDYEALAYNLINAINGNDDSLTAEEKLRYEVMQFTGLKDKNGKEIYEGDIVKVDFDGEEQTIHTVVYGIEYDYPAFDLKPDLDCDCNGLQHCICSGSTSIEVIGNIYENSELMKEIEK